jgi:hypothetical protein
VISDIFYCFYWINFGRLDPDPHPDPEGQKDLSKEEYEDA